MSATSEPLLSDAVTTTRELLRVCTCGSVDDGKSTLLGRLLVDAKAALSDQVEAAREATARRGGEGLDLSLLVDGLRAEREQGITIDVAHRFFSTPRRSFVLADCPGHVQYTRNMVTGASESHAAIVLVDARHGVVEQTRRHLAICRLLGVAHRIVCVNKMDLVDGSQARFDQICSDVLAVDRGVEAFVPMSALTGANVAASDPELLPWHDGPPLLELLETLDVADEPDAAGARLPVQWVIRDGDDRWLAGRVAGGRFAVGDEVEIASAAGTTSPATIAEADGPLVRGRSVRVRLDRHADVARGDVLAPAGDAPASVRELEATVCWMAETPLRPGARLALKHGSRWVRAAVDEVVDRLELASGLHRPADALELNDLGAVRLRTQAPLAVDLYAANRTTGAFLLVDEATNETVGAGMVTA